MTAGLKENELFYPLKKFFEKMGYIVEGEVKECDILVKTESDYMVIELKTDFNFKVVLQATQRQKMFDYVYIALPIYKIKQRNNSFREKLHLLKRLGIGLLLVNPVTKEVECMQQPLEAERTQVMARNKIKKERVITEFEKRIVKNNVGGSSRSKITTFYRQQCLQVAYLLKDKPQSAADLAKSGMDRKRIYTILKSNVYGWFDKVEKGIYQLSDSGRQAIQSEAKIIKLLMKELEENKVIENNF